MPSQESTGPVDDTINLINPVTKLILKIVQKYDSVDVIFKNDYFISEIRMHRVNLFDSDSPSLRLRV